MERVELRFYEELNDFLPINKRKHSFSTSFLLPRSVKDLVESLGVPHVEIDLILVNGVSVGFEYIIRDGDRISVYPLFESFDISGVSRLRTAPKDENRSLRTAHQTCRFVADVHLGKLARRLRTLGFDVTYERNACDRDLAEQSRRERRILLTRDRGLLKRSIVDRGLFIRSEDPETQVIEILERLDLYHEITPLARCIRCNGCIALAAAEDISSEEFMRTVPVGVQTRFKEFSRCSECGRFYWKGSHYYRLIEWIHRISAAKSEGQS